MQKVWLVENYWKVELRAGQNNIKEKNSDFCDLKTKPIKCRPKGLYSQGLCAKYCFEWQGKYLGKQWAKNTKIRRRIFDRVFDDKQEINPIG